jgi:hypothetical protein
MQQNHQRTLTRRKINGNLSHLLQAPPLKSRSMERPFGGAMVLMESIINLCIVVSNLLNVRNKASRRKIRGKMGMATLKQSYLKMRKGVTPKLKLNNNLAAALAALDSTLQSSTGSDVETSSNPDLQ